MSWEDVRWHRLCASRRDSLLHPCFCQPKNIKVFKGGPSVQKDVKDFPLLGSCEKSSRSSDYAFCVSHNFCKLHHGREGERLFNCWRLREIRQNNFSLSVEIVQKSVINTVPVDVVGFIVAESSLWPCRAEKWIGNPNGCPWLNYPYKNVMSVQDLYTHHILVGIMHHSNSVQDRLDAELLSQSSSSMPLPSKPMYKKQTKGWRGGHEQDQSTGIVEKLVHRKTYSNEGRFSTDFVRLFTPQHGGSNGPIDDLRINGWVSQPPARSGCSRLHLQKSY